MGSVTCHPEWVNYKGVLSARGMKGSQKEESSVFRKFVIANECEAISGFSRIVVWSGRLGGGDKKASRD